MTTIFFRHPDGAPVAGAVVAITSAPGEMTDLGYVTDDDGSIAVSIPASGYYGFTLTAADGKTLVAGNDLLSGRQDQVIAHVAER